VCLVRRNGRGAKDIRSPFAGRIIIDAQQFLMDGSVDRIRQQQVVRIPGDIRRREDIEHLLHIRIDSRRGNDVVRECLSSVRVDWL
jgi:hypothetical protein